jgi:hypothetical protein
MIRGHLAPTAERVGNRKPLVYTTVPPLDSTIMRRADRLVFGSFWGVEPNASPTARLHARSAADRRKNNPPAALRGARGSPKPSLPLLYDSTVSSRRGASASTILTLSASPQDGQTRASSPWKKCFEPRVEAHPYRNTAFRSSASKRRQPGWFPSFDADESGRGTPEERGPALGRMTSSTGCEVAR